MSFLFKKPVIFRGFPATFDDRKRLHSEPEKPTILKFGKSTISMDHGFNSYVTNYQRVPTKSLVLMPPKSLFLLVRFTQGCWMVAGGCWDDYETSDDWDHSRKFPT